MAALRPDQLVDTLRAIDPDAQLDRLESGYLIDGHEVVGAYWRGFRASWTELYAAPDLTGWDWNEPDAHFAFEDLILGGMPLIDVRVTGIDWMA